MTELSSHSRRRALARLWSALVVLAGTRWASAAPAADNAQKVIDACKARWEANKADCNKFVKAVAGDLGISIPADADADAIIAHLESSADWSSLNAGDGTKAKTEADAGKLVIGGMKGADLKPKQTHGHVLVVVSGPLDSTHTKYPTAYWGKLGGVGQKNGTVNYSFNKDDRDRVKYFVHSLP